MILQMPTIPVPCTNCLRFHYGVCYDPPKQCYRCGGSSHIERYCPHRRRIQNDPGEPLPGTRAWCDKHGLDHDPELKWKILNAIKTSPGCAIWVNDECIYGGNQQYFVRDDRPRGRPLEERITRRRSRSPLRERFEQRSPSPLRRYDHGGYDVSPPRMRRQSLYDQRRSRFRSRSPIRRRSPSPYYRRSPSPYYRRSPSPYYRRSPSPYYRRSPFPYYRRSPSPYYRPKPRPRSQRYTRDSNADFYRPKDNSPESPKQTSFIPEFHAPLSNVTNINNATEATTLRTENPTNKRPVSEAQKENESYTLRSSPPQAPVREEPHVDDPHFVLGVVQGAGEQE
jgi:hypothetical protein